jgi:hypothetical protein
MLQIRNVEDAVMLCILCRKYLRITNNDKSNLIHCSSEMTV